MMKVKMIKANILTVNNDSNNYDNGNNNSDNNSNKNLFSSFVVIISLNFTFLSGVLLVANCL